MSVDISDSLPLDVVCAIATFIELLSLQSEFEETGIFCTEGSNQRRGDTVKSETGE